MFSKYSNNITAKGLLILLVVGLAGCGQSAKSFERYSERAELMGTIVELDVCAPSGREEALQPAFEQVWARLRDIGWRMSVFEENTDVTNINRSFQNPVEVGKDTYQLIELSETLNRRTLGAFDITVYPLVQLWKSASQENKMPSRKDIATAKKKVGIEHIKLLGESRAEVVYNEASIDLGGIAKGYAIDEAARIFRENGVDNFMIDAGGDLYVGGLNCQGKPWRIGIRDPRNTKEVLEIIAISDMAVATSGDYERYFEIRGEKFSHIINPVTGRPQSGVVSATVIGPSATEADAYATALCVLDPAKGNRMIDRLEGPWASLVMTQHKGAFKRDYSRRYGKLRAKSLK